MLAARLANLGNGVRRDRAVAASIEAATTQSEAAKTLKVGRPSVQRATAILRTASGPLIKAVEHGLIPVSTASKLLVLSEAEQVKIATCDNPRRAARQAADKLDLKKAADRDVTGLSKELMVEFENFPTFELRERVLLFDERTISSEQREQLTEVLRGVAGRIVELANRVEEPTLCERRNCSSGWRGARAKRIVGQNYCSPLCAERAGGPLAWRQSTPAT
jgi:hypothetical protein